MTNKDQISYMLLREKQHRERAGRANREDSKTFYEMLAAIFRRLGNEARAVAVPDIDIGAGDPLNFDW